MHYITALWRKIEHELPPAFNIHTHTEERFAQLRCFFEASRTMSVIFIVNNSFLFWMHGYVVKCIDIVIELWENMRTHCRSCFLRKLLSSPLSYDKIGTESVAARDWSKVCHICDCFIYLSKCDILWNGTAQWPLPFLLTKYVILSFFWQQDVYWSPNSKIRVHLSDLEKYLKNLFLNASFF